MTSSAENVGANRKSIAGAFGIFVSKAQETSLARSSLHRSFHTMMMTMQVSSACIDFLYFFGWSTKVHDVGFT
jgi:hypothetical protein